MSSFCSICKSYWDFFSKNTCELDVVLTRTVNILTTNKLVMLTILWTTGPWFIMVNFNDFLGSKEGIFCSTWISRFLWCSSRLVVWSLSYIQSKVSRDCKCPEFSRRSLLTKDLWSCWTQIYPAFTNSVEPDHLAFSEAQLTFSEANWSGSALFVIMWICLSNLDRVIWLADN